VGETSTSGGETRFLSGDQDLVMGAGRRAIVQRLNWT
jgi:hypothetical protein